MTTQGQLSLTISLGQGRGASLVCHNQASGEHLEPCPELGASSPSEAGLWTREKQECTFVPNGSLAYF